MRGLVWLVLAVALLGGWRDVERPRRGGPVLRRRAHETHRVVLERPSYPPPRVVRR